MHFWLVVMLYLNFLNLLKYLIFHLLFMLPIQWAQSIPLSSPLFSFIFLLIVILPSPRLTTATIVLFSMVSTESVQTWRIFLKLRINFCTRLLLSLHQLFTRRKLRDIVPGTSEPIPCSKSMFSLVHCCYFAILMITYFRLMKGRVTIFWPETIVGSSCV